MTRHLGLWSLMGCLSAMALPLGCSSAKQSLVSVSLTASPSSPDISSVSLIVGTVSRTFPTPSGLTSSPVTFGVYVGATGNLTISAMTPAVAGCLYSGAGSIDVKSAGSSVTAAVALTVKCVSGTGGAGGGGTGGAGGGGTGGAGGASGSGGITGTGGAQSGGSGGGGAAGAAAAAGGSVGTGGMGTGGAGLGGNGTGASGGTGNGGASSNPPSLAHCNEYDHNATSNVCNLNANPPVGNWAVRSVAFAPNAPLFVSGSEDGRVKIWNYSGRTLTEEGHVFGGFGSTTYVGFSPDGTLLAVGSRNIVKVWKVSDWSLNWQLTINNEDVYSLAFLDNQHIVAVTDAKNVSWLTVGSSTLTTAVVPSIPYSLAVSASAGNTTVAVGMSNGGTQLLSVTSAGVFAPIGSIAATSAGMSVAGIAFSADGKTLAVGSDDSVIRFFQTPFSQQDGASLIVDVNMQNRISSLAFSPSGKNLASGTYGGELDLFDLPNRQNRAQSGSLAFFPTAVAFSPTGTAIGLGEFNCGKIAICAD